MRLSEYPFVIVRIACERCGRSGRYRLARLAATYGAETEVETIVRRLIVDCVYRTGGDRLQPKSGAKTCWATLIDLNDIRRPPDLPPITGAFTVVTGGKKG
jgi:hypothetical protein